MKELYFSHLAPAPNDFPDECQFKTGHTRWIHLTVGPATTRKLNSTLLPKKGWIASQHDLKPIWRTVPFMWTFMIWDSVLERLTVGL